MLRSLPRASIRTLHAMARELTRKNSRACAVILPLCRGSGNNNTGCNRLQWLPMVEIIYQTRETVIHQDIQTPRRELKIRRTAEYI